MIKAVEKLFDLVQKAVWDEDSCSSGRYTLNMVAADGDGRTDF